MILIDLPCCFQARTSLLLSMVNSLLGNLSELEVIFKSLDSNFSCLDIIFLDMFTTYLFKYVLDRHVIILPLSHSSWSTYHHFFFMCSSFTTVAANATTHLGISFVNQVNS
ncbi:hypothetical protein SK128_028315 [Halocaridina rubra]|uniref:Uncharacterized protein n=1 Tax=Halocaridina rubra TaxID=373956 RepID=A0AAN8XKS9_HALRR